MMCERDLKGLVRRYDVPGARTLSNYWWGTTALIGGFGFLLVGLYSYYLKNFSAINSLAGPSPEGIIGGKTGIGPSVLQNALSGNSINEGTHLSLSQNFEILFFPQGLSMCFYGLIGILLGFYLWFCIFFQIGCGFTEFDKETCNVKIFRLGFPGEKRVINITYSLENIQCICVKITSGIVPVGRGIYMRLKLENNQTRDIPLDLYFEKSSLENIEQMAADLSKFLRVSLSIL